MRGFIVRNSNVSLSFYSGGYYVDFTIVKPLFLSTHVFQMFCAPQAVDRIPAHHHRPFSITTHPTTSSRILSEELLYTLV